MVKDLTETERAIIQQVVLDRWNPLRLNKKIASHFGLTINQVRHIRSKSAFQTEYKRQLAIYQSSFEEIQLADRKERVLAMQELYEKIPDIRVALKLKILAQIRAEVGQDEPIQQLRQGGDRRDQECWSIRTARFRRPGSTAFRLRKTGRFKLCGEPRRARTEQAAY